MKTLNQVVTVLLLIFLLVLLPIVATVPDAVLNAVQSATFAIEPWVMTTVGRVVTGVLAALLWLAVIWVLWREVRQGGDRTIQVAEVEEGRARVAEASVAKLLEARVSAAPDVKGVSAKVRQTAKEGVVVDLSLSTAGEVRVPDVARRAIEAARQTLETEIGARVARVDVRVKEVGRAEGTVMAPLAAAVPSSGPESPAETAPEPVAPSWTEPCPEPAVMPEADEPVWQPAGPVETQPEWVAPVAGHEEPPHDQEDAPVSLAYLEAVDEATELAADGLSEPADAAVDSAASSAEAPDYAAELPLVDDVVPPGLAAERPLVDDVVKAQADVIGDAVAAEEEPAWDELKDSDDVSPDEGATGQA